MNQNKNSNWKGKTRGGTFGYLFFIFLIKIFGIRAAYAFLTLVIIYFIPFAPKATRSVWSFARKRLGYGKCKSCWFLIRNYYLLGQTLIDKVAVGMGKTKAYQFDFGDNYDQFLQILNQPTGVILMGAHVGNWEIGAPFFDQYGKKMNVVMYDAEYQKIKQVLEQNKKEQNYKIIPVNQDSLAHVFEIKNALDKQEYICFQGDRFVEGSQTLESTFLNEKAAFPSGPYLLASKLRVPVVFFFAVREKGMKYKFRFVPAKDSDVKGKNSSAQYLLEQYTSVLEGLVKQYPEQWFNYYDFWKLPNNKSL
ncbi:LpxL/LpxP family acyltransferase [Massilibacteroides vaginae]|jgi:predicted LPLAT superfamily acyltransferase|uniref:LpxL/LpxP family acyltransferase n=1 Tax=Massilibacteroides vaginae TaxID=1673718 RepID=UPI000A1CD618|nr:acyltransferase [Massilibacteroides vaginae]